MAKAVKSMCRIAVVAGGLCFYMMAGVAAPVEPVCTTYEDISEFNIRACEYHDD